MRTGIRLFGSMQIWKKNTLLGSSLVALVSSNAAKPNESLTGYYFPFHLPVMDRWRLSVYCDSAIMMMGSTWWQAWCSSDDDGISDWTDVIITSSLSWVVPLRLNFHSFQKHRYRYMIMQQPLRSFIQWYIVRLHSLGTGGNHTFWYEYWRYVDSLSDKVVPWHVWKSNVHNFKLSFHGRSWDK